MKPQVFNKRMEEVSAFINVAQIYIRMKMTEEAATTQVAWVLSIRLSFHASATSPCTYNNTQATWVVAASSVIFILIYIRAALMNALTSSILLLKTWGFATSTLLLYCWRSILLTCCCRVAIIARSCSSQVGWWGADT